ncbi:tetratricopeptide repeat protein [Saccharothrix longispora]|uniref:DNA-binding SARP family transcriptional activator/Flp pilus assembly protein TadD n=1 Tax=Saccharothrix longispora TaxID=33920 RepID=A0ABU1Q6L4_9PSEU|nr:tetratricopeptide repeat protein [Saccharothrix longispora]MDR6598542.1 DNA-binding SARP family transcriptional activator/Flp pilus assembly protein TadD [Saccharothrix longispora]
MDFKIMGKTRLHIDGKDHDLGPAKHRGVLAMLLYYFPQSVQIDRIARVVWPGNAPDQVRSSLQPIISKLRAILAKSGTGASILKEGHAYRLVVEPPEAVDYYRFRKLADQGLVAAQAGDHRAAKELLRAALALWDGRPMQELEGNWADRCRDQMETFDRLPALYTLLDCQHRLGEHLEVMAEAGRLTATLAPDEAFAGLYMRSLDALGRYSAALHFYAAFCHRLFEHIGAEPGPQLRDLYRSILRKQNSTASSGVRPPHQIPLPARNFIGREELLAELDALLDGGGGRVVALHGMPSVGKSQLALKWAARRLGSFPDGNLYVELRGYSAGTPVAADDVLAFLLRSLGAERIPATGDERRLELRRIIGGRRLLILLDDAHESTQVRPVLAATPNCVTLITSRTRLFGLGVLDHVDLKPVPPLSSSESVSLLRKEIGRTRADEDPSAVRDLAGLVDGLPLGLRIIAQQVAHRPGTPIADLVEEFRGHDGLGVLGAVHDSDDASATLPVAFSWSFKYLPDDTAHVFRLLGLNPTTEFGVDVVSALLGEPAEVVGAHLGVLVRHNLLDHGTAPKRFRLHDTLHGFALLLVRRDEATDVRVSAMKRMLDWFLASSGVAAHELDPQTSPVPPLPGMSTTGVVLNGQAEALRWLGEERANLVAAVSLAVRHGFHDHAWRISANFHEAYDRSGYYEDVLVSHRVALKAATALRDPEAISGTHSNLGMVLYRLERYVEAREHFKTGAEIAERIGAQEIQLICSHNLASIHLALGEVSAAIELHRKTLEAVRASGYQDGEAYALNELGNAYRKAEQDDLALRCYYEALAIRRSIGHLRGVATTLTDLGTLHLERGGLEAALLHLREALTLHPVGGDRGRMSEALVALTEVEYNLGRFDDAIVHAESAAALCDAIGARERRGHALRLWGDALAAMGEADEAEERWRLAEEVLRESGSIGARGIGDHLAVRSRTRAPVPHPRSVAPHLGVSTSPEVIEQASQRGEIHTDR